jgi:DNA-binding transcriptional MerR regulator
MTELIPDRLYYSISEVSDHLGVEQHVLRYWETEFPKLNPPKNRAGNRTYRKKDIDMLLEIKKLLYDEKFTIEGARQRLKKNDEPAGVPELPVAEMARQHKVLGEMKKDLEKLLAQLD